MPREEKQYPRNMQEFMDQGWDLNIKFRIGVFNLKDSLNNPEDLLQDILLALLQTNYISRYSQDKGSFKTYLYGFVDNFLKKKYNKENTRHGKFIVNAASLTVSSPESDSDFDGTEVFAELLDAGIDIEKEIKIKAGVEEIRKELAECYDAKSTWVYKGVEYNRDPLTVFDLMMQGATVMDVSEILNVSRQFVYHLLKKIRSAKSFQELMSDL